MRPKRYSSKQEHHHPLPKNPLTSRDVEESDQTSPVETCGELFSDGKCIELIRDSDTGRLQLLAFDGDQQKRGACVEVGGQAYVPAELHPSILSAMTLPANCVEYGTTDKLFTAIEKSLIKNGVLEDIALPQAHFVLATWFSDCLPAAPCLVITGPSPEASLLFRLLGCLVRHPMPLIDISKASFHSALMSLQPTFLIDQEPPPSTMRLVIATNNPNAHLSINDRVGKSTPPRPFTAARTALTRCWVTGYFISIFRRLAANCRCSMRGRRWRLKPNFNPCCSRIAPGTSLKFGTRNSIFRSSPRGSGFWRGSWEPPLSMHQSFKSDFAPC